MSRQDPSCVETLLAGFGVLCVGAAIVCLIVGLAFHMFIYVAFGLTVLGALLVMMYG